MNNFNWSKEDILNSNLSDRYKEMLLAELNGKITLDDPTNTRDNMQGHLELGRNFREDMKDLIAIDPRMADISLNECLNYNADDDIIINIPLPGLKPQDLVEELGLFFKYLHDNEIELVASELLDPNNGHIRITSYDENNPICKEVNGRCIKSPEDDVIFASYYMRNSIHDYTTLAHETGHMISGKIFGSNINPLVKRYLSEVEAYYFELLCAEYLNSLTTDEHLLYVAHLPRLAKSIDYMWDIRKQYILSRHLFKPSLRRFNKEIQRIPNGSRINSIGYTDLYRFHTGYINVIIHSALVATDLYQITVQDQKEGLRLFKEFMLSRKDTIQELYSDAQISYLEDDCKNFRNLHEKTKTLKNLIK